MAEEKIAAQIVPLDSPFRLYDTDAANFGRYGYHIIGWQKSPDEPTPVYEASQTVSYSDISSAETSGYVDLYAVWGRNSYDIKAVNCPSECDISVGGLGSYLYEAQAVISVREPIVEDDYGFVQWNFPDGSASSESPVRFIVLSSMEISAMFKDLRTIWMASLATEQIWRYKDLPEETNGVLMYMYSGECAPPFADDQYLSAASALYQLSVFEEDISAIGLSSFRDCFNLVSAECPYVKTVGREAFLGCSSLVYLDMRSATTLEDSSFGGCQSLVSAIFPELLSVGAAAFAGCSNMSSIGLPNVNNISSGAFEACSSLAEIDCPKIQIIGERAFNGCSALTGISDFKNALSVGEGAFQQCTGLTAISLLSAKDVCASAFSDCTQLTAVTMHCVSAIGKNAFQNCINLKKLDFGYTLSAPAVDSIGELFKGIVIGAGQPKISCYVPYNYDAYLTWVAAEDNCWLYNLSDWIDIIRRNTNQFGD